MNALNTQTLRYNLHLFCEIYMVERSKEYQINNERSVSSTSQKSVSRRYKGRELKKVITNWPQYKIVEIDQN